jgi:transposase
MEVVMLSVGIDISKASFDVAFFAEVKYKNKQFNNDLKGFKALSKWLKPIKENGVLCMEATGVYGVMLAKYLHQHDEKIIVANPIKTHSFAKMEMSRNKTDKADAQSIARYCKHIIDKGDLDKSLFKPKSEAFERLGYLVTRLEQMSKQLTQELNRLPVSLDKATTRSIKSMIKYINKQMLALEGTIQTLVKKDDDLNKQVELLTSIKGIGNKTAWAILAYLGDVSLFDNAKQVASFAGLNPKITQSGTSINKTSLSKVGHKKLRKSLYMPALVAAQYNPLLMDLYQRLQQRGKPKKVALCAVMRKLLVISYGVLKSEQPFDVNYVKVGRAT